MADIVSTTKQIPIRTNAIILNNDIFINGVFEDKLPPPQPPTPSPHIYKMPKHMRKLGKYFFDFGIWSDYKGMVNSTNIYFDINEQPGWTVTNIDGFYDLPKPKNVLKEEVVNSPNSDVYVSNKIYHMPHEITIHFYISDFFWYIYGNLVNDILDLYYFFIREFSGKKIWIKSFPHQMKGQYIGLKDVKPSYMLLDRAKGQNVIGGKLILENIIPALPLKYEK